VNDWTGSSCGTAAQALTEIFFFFCRQYLPDSTIPQGLAKQADVAFCFMPGA
jgi:hypothetical protein